MSASYRKFYLCVAMNSEENLILNVVTWEYSFFRATAESLYLTLGVNKQSSTEEIKKAYIKLALTCHPDEKNNNPKDSDRVSTKYWNVT